MPANKVQIVIEVEGRQELQQVKSALHSLGPSAATAGQAASAGIGQLSTGLSQVQRTVVGFGTVVRSALAFAGATSAIGFLSDSVGAANELRASTMGLSAAAKNFGVDAGAAKAASEALAKDGFLSLSDSSRGLQNLLASGLSLPQATLLMTKNKDAAIFNRQSHLGLSESIRVFTQGFKDEISTLTDATGVSTNYARALESGFKAVKTGQVDLSKYRFILSDSEIAQLKHTAAAAKSTEKLDKQSRSLFALLGFLPEFARFSG